MRSSLPVLVLLLASCGPQAPQPGAPAPARSEAPQARPIQARADWLESRLLPAADATIFEGRRYVYAPPRRAVSLSRPEEAQPAPAAPAVVAPAPYKYVGRVVRGSDERYVVLAREDRMFVVRAGDVVNGYDVQSVSDARVVLVDPSGAAHVLAYGADTPPKPAAPMALAGPSPVDRSAPAVSEDEAADGGG